MQRGFSLASAWLRPHCIGVILRSADADRRIIFRSAQSPALRSQSGNDDSDGPLAASLGCDSDIAKTKDQTGHCATLVRSGYKQPRHRLHLACAARVKTSHKVVRIVSGLLARAASNFLTVPSLWSPFGPMRQREWRCIAILQRSTAGFFVSGGLHLSPDGPLGLEKL
jgi:hypothetical protein